MLRITPLLSKTFVDFFTHFQSGKVGYIIGYGSADAKPCPLTAINIMANLSKSEKFSAEEIEEMNIILPQGLKVIGLHMTNDFETADLVSQYRKASGNSGDLVVAKKDGFFLFKQGSSTEPLTLEKSLLEEESMLQEFAIIRTSVDITFSSSNRSEEVEKVKKQLENCDQDVFFTTVEGQSLSNSNATCASYALKISKQESQDVKLQTSSKKQETMREVLGLGTSSSKTVSQEAIIQGALQVSTYFKQQQQPAKAPLLTISAPSSSQNNEYQTITLDVVVYAQKDQAIKQALAQLVQGLKAQLSYITTKYPSKFKLARFYHFLPQTYPHILSICYSFTEKTPVMMHQEELEERLRSQRDRTHQRLYLFAQQPFVRLCNAITFRNPNTPQKSVNEGGVGGPRLLDVHLYCPKSKVKEGKYFLVKGSYRYYHYMQDKYNDDGWGCAYRSLQTLISWFQINMNMQADKPVPTHREIQQTLVACGDKKASIIGSNNWIGAFECSVVLDSLLGVQCRVLNVERGTDISDKNREFARHFQDNGTPIMIGGGVLAYTMLGVCYNENTGECEYLILDPHYTGKDTDIDTIVQKKWCNWRQKDLFKTADYFYNFCMPLTPKSV